MVRLFLLYFGGGTAKVGLFPRTFEVRYVSASLEMPFISAMLALIPSVLRILQAVLRKILGMMLIGY